jgi:hypothetical protein
MSIYEVILQSNWSVGGQYDAVFPCNFLDCHGNIGSLRGSHTV